MEGNKKNKKTYNSDSSKAKKVRQLLSSNSLRASYGLHRQVFEPNTMLEKTKIISDHIETEEQNDIICKTTKSEIKKNNIKIQNKQNSRF